MVTVWEAREATLKIDNAKDVTITTAAVLDSFWSSGETITSYARNVTLALPEQSLEKIDLLGVNASSFQNAARDLKPLGMATFSGTMVLPNATTQVLEKYYFPTTATVATNYTRYTLATAATTVAVLVNMAEGTVTEISAGLDNAVVTRLGDMRITSDGVPEIDFEVTCLPEDVYFELKTI